MTIGYWRKTINIIEALNLIIFFFYQTGLKALNRTVRTQPIRCFPRGRGEKSQVLLEVGA